MAAAQKLNGESRTNHEGRVDNHAVQAVELTKMFGEFTAVDRVSFTIERGVIFGFLGPNGAGKTTTIRMLLGLLKPTEGSATVLGFDIVKQTAEVKKRIGYMSQRFSLYDDLTVDENLNFYGRIYGVRNRHLRVRKKFVLEMAGLVGRERGLTRNLSGGWKQRLALGAAILHEPEMLFLDEPTAGVDPISRRAFWDLLYELATGGTTIMVTTARVWPLSSTGRSWPGAHRRSSKRPTCRGRCWRSTATSRRWLSRPCGRWAYSRR